MSKQIDEAEARAIKHLRFEKRMDNWRRTVLYLGHGGGTMGPSWAAAYIKQRNAEALNDRPSLSNLVVTDSLDGWVVEQAWRKLKDEDHKTVLKLWYVSRLNDKTIRCRMHLRRMPVQHLLECAKNELQKVLAQTDDEITIQINNLRAAVASPLR